MESTTAAESITSTLNNEYCEYMKLFKLIDRKHESKLPKRFGLVPWITKGIVTSIKIRNSLLKSEWKKYNATGKIYKSRIAHYIKILRENYFKTQINNINKNSPTAQWEFLYYFLKINKNKKDIKIDCNELNDHFINIGNDLASKIPKINITSKTKIESKSIFFEPICAEEIKLTIKSLKNNSAPGWDKISVQDLKKSLEIYESEIPIRLAEFFNSCINNSYFPDKLKYAIINPVYKNNGLSKNDLNNYRPISLISNISKIFEKCINSRITNFLEKNKLLSDLQYGFRKGRSTEKAISKLISHIKTKKKYKLAIFFDIKKAFDTIDHKILIRRLDNIGIRGNILEILKSYLSNRTCCTKIFKDLSNLKTINCGVPQGTSLAPLLFNIYINSLAEIKINGNLVLFADDTALVIDSDDHSELYQKANDDLFKIRNWLIENKLSLNITKTQYIDFSNEENLNDKLTIHDFNCQDIDKCKCSDLEKVNSYKYLGCTIDQKLTWDVQINNIIKRITDKKTFSVFNILTDKRFKKSVYSALIQSHLQYAISIWGEKDKLSILQEKVNNITHKFQIEDVDTLEDLLKHRLYKEYYNLHYLIREHFEIFGY